MPRVTAGTVSCGNGILRERLFKRVDQTVGKTLTPRSRYSCANTIMRYLSWGFCNGEALLEKEVLSSAFRLGVIEAPSNGFMSEFLRRKPPVPPIDFERFDSRNFWCGSRLDKSQRKLPVTSRSRTERKQLPVCAPSTISRSRNGAGRVPEHRFRRLFCGLRRERVVAEQRGGAHSRRVKLPLPFQAYATLCSSFQASEAPEDVLAHTFLTLQWNLVRRTASKPSICLSHLRWSSDALGIVIPTTKNDQTDYTPTTRVTCTRVTCTRPTASRVFVPFSAWAYALYVIRAVTGERSSRTSERPVPKETV